LARFRKLNKIGLVFFGDHDFRKETVKMEADFSGYATKAGLKCSDGRTIMPDAFKHQDQVTVPLVWQHSHGELDNVLGHAVLEHREDGVYTYAYFNDSDMAQKAKALVLHRDITKLSIWANQLIERSGRVLHGMIREVSLVLSGANPGAFIDKVNIRHGDGELTEVEDEAIIYTGLEIELRHSAETVEKGDAQMSDTATSPTIQDVYDSMSQEQKDVVAVLVAQALEDSDNSLAQSAITNTNEIKDTLKEIQEGITMKHSIFDQTQDANKHVVSHADVKSVVDAANKRGSFKEAVEEYALVHNITDIDVLFPDAQNVLSQPEFNKRRTEWVTNFLNGTNKTPFSRIKTLSADLTFDQARAKGYVKGNLKREEFFSIGKRVTTPTTVYKRQKLDRDDMIEITDFDVVAWLKAEMRIMLDEEIARAALVGDGRDVSDTDKISETNIRPIASDHELFTTTVNVNILDGSSSMMEVVDAIIAARRFYKGTGLPNAYMSESTISKFLLLKDSTGRRIYTDLSQLAAELRVSAIVGCEILEDYTSIVGIIVNPIDYTMGATAGGQVSMFDDFDIDYNQQKYLIETRLCGALTKLKSALVVKQVAQSVTLVTPTKPTFVASTGVVTIPTVTGVTYKAATYNSVTGVITEGSTLSAGAQTAINAGATTYVVAVPSSASYAFNTSAEDFWAFTRN
jgi:hypothetical protein